MLTRFHFLLVPLLFVLATPVACDRSAEDRSPETSRSPGQTEADSAGSPLASPAASPGSEKQKLQQNLGHLLSNMATRQAKGLGGGAVRVNGAWIYTGYSHLAPNPESPVPAHLVAVDLTIEGHTADFDIDDIEIVDGATIVSYGSDPHFTLLDSDGQPTPPETALPPAPLPLRALLIYAYPVGSPTFKLFYWGKDLLPEPRSFAKSGWSLPHPPENGEP